MAIKISGKFQGTIAPTTPKGCRCSSTFRPSLLTLRVGKSMLVKLRKNIAAPITSRVASANGLPCSWVSNRASSAAFF